MVRASHQSQGKIEHANRVINGVCVRCGYHLRIVCEKNPSDSILIAWLIRHASWCLTRFQVKNNGRTAFVRVFGKMFSSQVLPIGERVMYKYTSAPTGNLDQRWCNGIWVGKAPMTDEHIILTENGVQKARSLHRVPLEERFVISELKKVRGLLWNGRAENLKATIVTQQDQGPSGHRRVYLTTKSRSKAFCNAWLQWLCRFGTTHRSMSSASGKGIGRRESRSCRNASRANHRACHRVPRISTGGTAGASILIIRSCRADASTKPSERADGFTDGVGTTRTQRAQRSAAKRDANK